MSLATTTLNSAADHIASLFDYIGLVDETGTEISGGSPAYARKAASWGAASNGSASLSSALTFDIPSGKTVAGWRGYSASTGGTDYGGGDLTPEAYSAQGQYILKATDTKITVANPA